MSVSVDSVMVTAGDGRQLQVLTTTGTDTPTVVLHMGTPAGLAQLPAQLVHDARCRIVTYARPGYGESTPQPSRTRWPKRPKTPRRSLMRWESITS